jgi:hypothetical protein
MRGEMRRIKDNLLYVQNQCPMCKTFVVANDLFLAMR